MISLKKERVSAVGSKCDRRRCGLFRLGKCRESWTNAWQGISCKDRLTVERQVSAANGTREPHGATSRNVEE